MPFSNSIDSLELGRFKIDQIIVHVHLSPWSSTHLQPALLVAMDAILQVHKSFDSVKTPMSNKTCLLEALRSRYEVFFR